MVHDTSHVKPLGNRVDRFVYDAQALKLQTNFVGTNITLNVSDFEGDVMPRTTGDRTLDIFDWTQVGRFDGDFWQVERFAQRHFRSLLVKQLLDIREITRKHA